MYIHTSNSGVVIYNIADIDSITFLILETVTDIDGNEYRTVQIGDQIWMAENLKVTHYRNGDPIPNVTDNTEWGFLSTGAWCVYDNDEENVETYGLFYNWHAVNDSRNIAPDGWHVPTDEEWKELEMHLGMSQNDADLYGSRGSPVGGKLKQTGTTSWNAPNTDATNESGFTVLGAGDRHYNYGTFDGMGEFAYFWCADEHSATYNGWSRGLFYDNSDVNRGGSHKSWGLSVRCVKD